MVKKTLEKDSQTILHSIACCLQNHGNGTKKNLKYMSADFPFFQFSFMATSSHWYQDWVEVTIACFET